MMNSFFTGVGIDISEHHIRFAQVSLFRRVKVLQEVELPDGLIVDERVQDAEKVKKLLNKKFASSALKGCDCRATLLIPESRVFSFSFILPKGLKKDQIVVEAKKIAQREIPIPFSKADVSVSQGSAEEGGVRTTLYAVDSELAAGFKDVVRATPFRLIAMEANTKSVLRLIGTFQKNAQIPKKAKDLIVIVDVGHSWTSISAYTLKGSNVYSRSFSHHSLAHTHTDGKHGLSQSIVDTIIETIDEVMVYFQQRERTVTSVYLSGFEALDRKLNIGLKKITSKEVPVQPLSDNIKLSGVDSEKMHQFGSAIGAAIRSSSPFLYNYQHNLLVKSKKLTV
jgi:hypothetical protein